MIRSAVGYRIQSLMVEKGLTYSSLSKKSGINRDHLYHLVDGSKEMGIDTAEKIADALKVPVKALFDFSGMQKENREDKLVIDEFRSLPANYWDFIDAKTDDLIHGLHNYPAVMIWPISNTILRIVGKYRPIHSLLDPFVGSGTVIVEGQKEGIKEVVGNDLNPLALLISKAKITLLTEDDFSNINAIAEKLNSIKSDNADLIQGFVDYVLSHYSIVDKGDWALKAANITNEYFAETPLSGYKVKEIENLGFWFRPESVIEIEILMQTIDEFSTENAKPFLYCTLSETIRLVSNTRNGEFKLYRKKVDRILAKKHDPIGSFISLLKKNIEKEKSYLPVASRESKVTTICENAQHLDSVKDSSIDIVITSPPYGDSHTTVAYGQYSRLSNTWLGLTDDKNLDSKLLGGKKTKEKNIKELQSPTLEKIIAEISKVDAKRASEVLDFYFDLDASLAEITRKVAINGYEFWVVGNRTVKLVNIPTDIILGELGEKYNLRVLDRYYRMISNKVMPNLNSPTNVAGNHAQTMTSEIIVFFKKIVDER